MSEIRPILAGHKSLIVGIANDQSIAYGCAEAFRAAGADLAGVATPVRISAGRGFSMTLRDARVEAVGETLPCPGQTAP